MSFYFEIYTSTGKPLVDVNDAPKGFHPVSINTVLAPNSNENKCNHCDWRKTVPLQSVPACPINVKMV